MLFSALTVDVGCAVGRVIAVCIGSAIGVEIGLPLVWQVTVARKMIILDKMNCLFRFISFY